MKTAAHYWSIGKVAQYLGISVVTLRRWDKKGSCRATVEPSGNIDVMMLIVFNDYFKKTNQKP